MLVHTSERFFKKTETMYGYFPLLTQKTLEERWQQIAAQEKLPKASAHPHLHIVAGQPGCGKSTFVSFAGVLSKTAYVCDADSFRKYHPQAQEIFSTDPFRYTKETGRAAQYWANGMLNRAREKGVDVLYPTTLLAGADHFGDVIAAFQRSGYEVTMHCLSVFGSQSLLGVLDRFESRFDEAEPPHWVCSERHWAAYDALPETVCALAQRGFASAVRIWERADPKGFALMEKTDTLSETRHRAAEIKVIVEIGRERALGEQAARYAHERLWSGLNQRAGRHFETKGPLFVPYLMEVEDGYQWAKAFARKPVALSEAKRGRLAPAF